MSLNRWLLSRWMVMDTAVSFVLIVVAKGRMLPHACSGWKKKETAVSWCDARALPDIFYLQDLE